MIVNYWSKNFRALFGGTWPTSMCCVDLETSGFSPERDVIVEWGHVLVDNGKIVDRLSLVIDWTDHPVVPMHWLSSRLRSVRQGMELAGKRYHHSIERMRAEGVKPDQALPFINEFVQTIKKRGVIFVGHNIVFEEKMLCANFLGFNITRDGFSFGDNGFLDTEGIEKASQALTNPRMYPRSGDTLRDYFHRVKYTNIAGLKSNLDDHCSDKYGFAKHGVRREDMHAAEVDAYCSYLLMEAFRSMIAPDIQTPPVFPNEDHKYVRRHGHAPPAPVMPSPASRRVRGQRNS
jgi:DNA polymerase III epsilon subunit-like protein